MVELTYLVKNDNTIGGILPLPCQSDFQQSKLDKWTGVKISKSFEVDSNQDIPAPFATKELLLAENGEVVVNIPLKAFNVKEAQKTAVAEKRNTLQFGWMSIGGLATIKNTFENQILIETGAVKYERYPTDIDTYFPEGIKIKTGGGDTDIMVIPTTVIMQVEKMTSLAVQKMFDIELAIRDIIVADYQEVIDGTKTLEVFEATDYISTFDSTLTTAIADTAVFAQPTEEPV